MEGKNDYIISPFHEEFFESQLRATYRYFFFTIQLAIQAALKDILNERKIKIVNLREIKISKIVHLIIKDNQKHLTEENIEDLNSLIPKYFSFNDYLHAMLDNTTLSKSYLKQANNFFTALSLVRNKFSHIGEEDKLTENEQKILELGKLSRLVNKEKVLVMDVEYLSPIMKDVIGFFDKVLV